jgi:CheY-like chemotaxis protein
MESQPGSGTEVRLWLPVAKAPVSSVTEAAPETDATPRQGSLLLVDDDALVRMGTSGMLDDMGYDVTEVEDAREALDLIEHGYHPDVVVTDHIMPGMTGAEFALRLRAEHPEIAILIISGYQGIDLIAPDIVRLSKPFRQIHLDASIAAARAQAHPSAA